MRGRQRSPILALLAVAVVCGGATWLVATAVSDHAVVPREERSAFRIEVAAPDGPQLPPGPASFDCGASAVVWLSIDTIGPDDRPPRDIVVGLARSGFGRQQGLAPQAELDLASSRDELSWVVRDAHAPSVGFAVTLEEWGDGLGFRQVQGCAR